VISRYLIEFVVIGEGGKGSWGNVYYRAGRQPLGDLQAVPLCERDNSLLRGGHNNRRICGLARLERLDEIL
jgi:hypothetical protein